MPLTLITTALLAGLELSINKVLALDPASQEKINKLDGSVLSIKSLNPTLEIFIIVRGATLNLCSYYEGIPHTSIVGTASALIKLLLAPNDSQAFHSNDLDIQGNLDIVQSLQKILINLNIDWEYHLSQFVGDIPTQAFSDTLSTVKEFSNNTKSSLVMDIDEYIHEEKKLFPSQNELTSFYHAVDQVKLKVDRAEARLNILARTKAENS